MKKSAIVIVAVTAILSFCITASAHSGRTDVDGGHRNQETGEYHYHHGFSAHDHPGGICPYSPKKTPSKTETTTPRPIGPGLIQDNPETTEQEHNIDTKDQAEDKGVWPTIKSIPFWIFAFLFSALLIIVGGFFLFYLTLFPLSIIIKIITAIKDFINNQTKKRR